MTTEVKMFEVGGCVRDAFLGRESKDVDFTVVADSFEAMVQHVTGNLGGTVFVSKPEFLTVRARVPGMTTGADFVLARKDGAYTDGRRPDEVTMGSLLDDLARRDLTVNAMARDCDTGDLVDPFGGQDDLKAGVLRAVGDAQTRFNEDPLRALRALRFSVTLRGSNGGRFALHDDLVALLDNPAMVNRMMATVSLDRVRDEMNKMLKADTLGTLQALDRFPALRAALFAGGALWLSATTATR